MSYSIHWIKTIFWFKQKFGLIHFDVNLIICPLFLCYQLSFSGGLNEQNQFSLEKLAYCVLTNIKLTFQLEPNSGTKQNQGLVATEC